ncbi:hypothetical protein EVAR_62472_1 [Eumeta japonica]|uniref:Uncharacterized protein n=1 Tax=Eumeta variegata TaxID=151549 RepID=A0A4C1ZN52_EUMVA|nr:hypothetical protein EVAR_62472_1 [Eumeta japonica]
MISCRHGGRGDRGREPPLKALGPTQTMRTMAQVVFAGHFQTTADVDIVSRHDGGDGHPSASRASQRHTATASAPGGIRRRTSTGRAGVQLSIITKN